MHQPILDNQNRLRLGLRPVPAGGAYSDPPDPLAGLNGPTSKGRGDMGREGKGRKGREGRGGEGRERGEGTGREGTPNIYPPLLT